MIANQSPSGITYSESHKLEDTTTTAR